MHQRRLDSIARLGTSRAPVGGWTNRHTSDPQAPSSSARVKHLQDEAPEDHGKAVLVKNEHQQIPAIKNEPQQPATPGPQAIKSEGTPSLSLSSLSTPAPQSISVEGSSRDPFGSYPIPVSDADHQLIQHCKYLALSISSSVKQVCGCTV